VAVVLSGLMNFVGVLVGGIAVGYALVELLPAEVLSPPDGGPAVAMSVSLFVAALSWNIGTWWFGLPNSSSHCLIGALIGVALGNALARSRSISEGVHWAQLWKVLEALALSPILGFVLAGALYFLCRRTLHDKHLYEPATDTPPIWWMRGILILTCSGVSFAHGTNDGQKSICRYPFILSICPFIDVNCTFRGVSGLHEAVPMALAVRGRPRLSLVP
jgi:PiT family inorganic phosphate transporter